MKLVNGLTTKIALGLSVGTLLFGGGSYWGWKAKVQREAVREQKIDDHLVAAETGFLRLEAVESRSASTGAKVNGLSARVDNLDTNVRTLIESQERTNEKLDKLSERLMDYLTARSRPQAR